MREYLKVKKETTFGSYVSAAGTKNTDFIIVELMQSNAYTVRNRPNRWTTRTADGYNRKLGTGSAQAGATGNLQLLLYPEQAQFILDWALKITGSNPLSESCSIDHAFVLEDDPTGTIHVTRDLGVKVDQFALTGEQGAQLLAVNLGLVAQKGIAITTTDFPEPIAADFPAINPYLFQHLDTPGYLREKGTTSTQNRPEFSSWSLTVRNLLDPTFNQSKYITRCKWCGRDITWSDRLVFLSAADRDVYEATTDEAAEARLDNGTNHIIFNFGASNIIETIEDELDFSRVYYQSLTWTNKYNRTAGTDIVYTVG